MSHKCTAASAAEIAKQIGPYVYAYSMPPGQALPMLPCTWMTTSHNVVTPMGPKTIQARHCGNQMVLTCPYTAEQFVFMYSPQLGAVAPAGGAPVYTSPGAVGATASSSGMSTGAKFAIGAGVLVGGGLLAAAIYSVAKKKSRRR
jgi:hypothetical protein